MLTVNTRHWLGSTRGAVLRPLLAVVAVIIGVGAVVSPSYTVVGLAGLAALALATRNLVGTLALFTILTFPEKLPAGFGTATVAKPLGLVLILAWAAYLVRNRRAPFLPRDDAILTSLLAGLVGLSVASALWARDGSVALSHTGRLIQVLLLFAVVYSSVRTAKDLRWLVVAYLIAAGLTAAYAIGSGATTQGRLTGGIADANFLAAEFVAAIILGGFMLAVTRRGGARLLLLGSIALDLAAMVSTQSRSGVIAMGVSLIVATLVAGRYRAYAIVGTLSAGAIGLVYYAVVASTAVRDRITNISAQGSAGRTDLWHVALRMFEGHPVGGVGLGNYPLVAADYAAQNLNLLQVSYVIGDFVTHNTYLEMLSELGVLGTAVFGLTLVVSLNRAFVTYRTLRSRLDDTSAVVSGLIAATVGMLVSYFFISGLYDKQLWFFLGLCAATSTLVRTVSRPGDAADPGRNAS